jgi:hypothetical protein
MFAKRSIGPAAVFTGLAALLPLGCGGSDAGAAAPGAHAPSAAANASAKSAAKVEPYSYPAPVSGHYAEANTGDFDLVDGLAYASSTAGGTVVFVTSEPIASPLLADAACPVAEARSLALLRDAGWLEITLDAAGKSNYFAGGTPLGGQGRETDVGGQYWKIETKNPAAGHAAAKVAYRGRGGFEFDLPIAKPKMPEVSEGERVQGHRVPADAPTLKEKQVADLYLALHAAAKAKDLGAFLAAQKFSAKTIAAVRGLAGIDEDFARLADRFLAPGDPGDTSAEQGYGGVLSRGVNAKGEKYSNYYQFEPCGDRLILVGISETKE